MAIRVALVGCGNCAKSLVEGTAFYSRGERNEETGLMHPMIGKYSPSDITICCCF